MKKRHIIIGLLFLVLLTHSAWAQKTDVKVDGQKIYDIIDYMASDQFLGRKPNTPEFFEVQDWVVKQYKAWGLEPAGEDGTFYQAVPISRNYTVDYGTPELIINGREFFARFGDFNIDPRSTTGKKFNGNVVFAGYGISAPDKGLDEYANLDVAGKIVLVLKGNPDDFEPPRNRFAERLSSETEKEEVTEKWTKESADTTKINVAYEKGAAGLLFYNPAPATGGFMRRFRPQVEASPFERDFIIVPRITERVFQWILWTDPQMSSRGFNNWMNGVRGDIRNKKAHSFDTKLKAEIAGFEKVLLKGKQFEDDKGRNIITKITGTDPELKDEYVVMGGHFDHLGMTNGQIFNGAEDNASGSAVVMEVARLMKQHNIRTRRTVIFCLWTAEEMGLVGSRFWVKEPTDGVTMDNVVTYFNMDMVALGDEIGAPGALNFPSIWDVIKENQDQDVLAAVKPRTGGPGGSDHSAFIELGIESLALMTQGEGGHPDYHDTGDDTEKLNPEILRKTGQLVLQGTINLANVTGQDLLIADRQHIYNGLMWPVAVINPDLGMEGSWSRLDATTTDQLSDLMTKKIEELKQPQQQGDMVQMMRRRFGGRMTLTTGIMGAETFDHNIQFLQIAKDILDFGRIDMPGEDGVWFNQGLTEQGGAALAAMEKKAIALHLMSPSKATLTAVLEKAKKPFLISGFTELDDDLIEQMNEKKVLICVEFDPQDIERALITIDDYKKKFGDTDNLLLNVTSKTGLDDAKQALYMHLVEKGWEKKDIYAIGGAGATRRSQGNLDPFMPPRRMPPGMR